MRALGRISYRLAAPRGWCELKKGMGEERRGGHARTRVGCSWGAKSSAHFQEGPELLPSGLATGTLEFFLPGSAPRAVELWQGNWDGRGRKELS